MYRRPNVDQVDSEIKVSWAPWLLLVFRLKNMSIVKNFVRVSIALMALGLIVGSTTEDFGDHLVGPERFGLCLTTFGSVVLLHVLVWQFIVGRSAILGREPTSFIKFGGSKTFFSGLTTLGYGCLAAHCLRSVGFLVRSESDVSDNPNSLVYGLAIGLILIGFGLAVRLRALVQNPRTISE
jgi:hypothetical protein